jgi:hypothetical protein
LKGMRSSREVGWWSERDSNPRHPLARRGLCRLSYRPITVRDHRALEIGVRGWFRANLSAFSARRCHQISFPDPPSLKLRRAGPTID